jgi:hypothetical protein
VSLKIHRFEFDFPAKHEPRWSSKVERWYQLDAASYGLAQAYTELKFSEHPHMMILASSGASNETDFQFAQSGAQSPSKFVHTLPSVRGAPLMQLMGWFGPLLCLQNDPHTWEDGLQQAAEFSSETNPLIWVLRVENLSTNRYEARIAEIKFDTSREMA